MPEEDVKETKAEASEETTEEKTGETKETPTSERKVTVGGQELSIEDIELMSKRLGNAEYYFNKLIKEGVIDERGEAIKKEVKEEVEEPDEVTKLRKEVDALKLEGQTKEIKQNLETHLSRANKAHELTRDDEDAQNLVNLFTTASYYMKPDADIGRLHKDTADALNKLIGKHVKRLLEKKIDPTKGEAPGGSATIALDKPFTSKDLKSGAVRKAFEGFLASIQDTGG